MLDRIEASVASPFAITFPVVAASARGALITDLDGNTFIDFAGGVGCLNVGHSHPHVVQAAQEQLDRFSHTDFTVVPYEVYAALSERLLALAPFSGPAKAAFFNAGTEAVENAVKFARAFTGRQAVIGFEGAFHGRTFSRSHSRRRRIRTSRASARSLPRSTGCRSNAYRGRDAARASPDVTSRAEDVAAIVFEPVQGEGGFIPATRSSCTACARSATSTASSSSATRCRLASRAPAASSRSSTSVSSPT